MHGSCADSNKRCELESRSQKPDPEHPDLTLKTGSPHNSGSNGVLVKLFGPLPMSLT